MLCYSTLGLPNWDLPDLCALLSRFGYQGIEIALTPEHLARRGDANFWRLAKDAARAENLTITCLHLGNPRLHPGGVQESTLLHADLKRRAYWIDLIAGGFEIAGQLNCPRVAATSGLPRSDLDSANSWSLLMESLNAALAARRGPAAFLIEHEPEHFIRATDDLLELNRRSNGAVEANVDIGHLEVAGEPLGPSIDRLAPVIRNLHLEDIRGRVHKHLLPGDGEINFEEVAAALARVRYSGPVTADLYPFAAAPVPALLRARNAFGPMAAAASNAK